MNFPDFKLDDSRPLGQQLSGMDIHWMSDFVVFIQQLPYGRNADRHRPELVLAEQKGTCSSKHALVKMVAIEQENTAIQLILGMYRMNKNNTPGIGDTMEEASLSFIPEAHCYLKVGESRFDLTSAGADFSKIEADLLLELEIQPEQVATFKVAYHQQYIKDWIKEAKIPFTFEDIWHIREACIAQLSGNANNQ